MELVHLDFLKIEINPDVYKNILICTDHFTGYAQAYVTRDETAVTTANVFLNEFCTILGVPEKIVTDQGRNFESRLMKEMCLALGVEKLRTTPYHPETNGQCERFNQTLIAMLGTLEEEAKARWPQLVRSLVRCYNATRNRMTGFSPHALMFGYNPRLPIDVDLGLPAPGGWLKGGGHSKYIKRLIKHLEWSYREAAKARSKESDVSKEHFDRHLRGTSLEPGDLVLVKRNIYPGKRKIADKWEKGQFVVVERIGGTDGVVYKVKPCDGGRARTLHRNQLLPLVMMREGNRIPRRVDEDEAESEDRSDEEVESDTEPEPAPENSAPGPRRSERLKKKS